MKRSHFLNLSLVAISALAVPSAPAFQSQLIPNTNQTITPTAPRGARFDMLNPGLTDYPTYTAGQAVTSVVSPDYKTLLILTSGYNLLNATSGASIGNAISADSNEYVFVYDVSTKTPLKKQVLQVPNTYAGMTFDPSGQTFYVSGGVNDNIHIYDLSGGTWSERSTSPIKLGHTAGNGLAVSPAAAGIAISSDGTKLVVANYYNDSISVLTKSGSTWGTPVDFDLRPGKIDPSKAGVAGGEYPFWVAINGNHTAYISSMRDREIDVVNVAGSPTLIHRIKVKGQPNRMALNKAGDRLFVAEDETDTVDVIDTAVNRVSATIPVGAPFGLQWTPAANKNGNNTNSVTLSPNEKTLYVTNGNSNDVAVVDVSGRDFGVVKGLIPTGWYPTSVSTNADGSHMYVVNAKSPTGPNPGNCHGLTSVESQACYGTNQYDLQLIKAGLQSFKTPTDQELEELTGQVFENDHFTHKLSEEQAEKFAFLRKKIKHVIYIIKENRTYDQILGDLAVGNGDPSLAEFGKSITPNFHRLAKKFVTLDNFYDRSEVSMDGWPWSTSARAPDVVEKQTWVNYAGRGLSYDSEGTNRNINVSYPTLAQRLAANPLNPQDPDVLPGTTNTAAPDGPDAEENTGYLWNNALRAGLSIRNYGFFIDLTRYNLPAPYTPLSIPELLNPFSTKTQVSFPTDAALRPYTDIYFRGFDNVFPDYYRFQEWSRDFDASYANGGLPALSFVRFMHDHTGNFSTALNGVNTPELQVADNDYAVGLLIDKISKSRYKDDTLVFVIEDDSQDGPDHVEAHRSIAFIAGPYLKQGAVVSKRHNTVDFVRTIEEVLGLKPMNLNDAIASPMADVFDTKLTDWKYDAKPSAMLANTTLPIDPSLFAGLTPIKPTHNSQYWAKATKGMDFSAEDRIDFQKYNRILWKGLMGNRPYPAPTGLDLSSGRDKLLLDSGGL